jgi:isopenicillin-N epimerase
MFSVELPERSIDKLGTRLWDDYRIEVPLVKWNGRELMRISIQAYNAPSDVQRLEDALRNLLSLP